MRLTVSKKFEFSASRRLFRRNWSEQENLKAFGSETHARYGTGRNYLAYFIFSGRINPVDGMLINVSDIKERITPLLAARYDHKFLNLDNPSFALEPPTVQKVAVQLLADGIPLFQDLPARLVACHLIESPERSATAYEDGLVESSDVFHFSAARRTISPSLTAEENEMFFGVAASPSGHGHNYTCVITSQSRGAADTESKSAENCLRSVISELDHRNLNVDVVALVNMPMTTESLARYLFRRAGDCVPITRVRLYEREDFFAEYHADGCFYLGMQTAFDAAHQLHSARLSHEQNETVYGKCHNARGHGHRYVVEATLGGSFDERSGTLYSFSKLQDKLSQAISYYQDKHLDLETSEFQAMPSTGENIVSNLWPRINTQLENRLTRLRLWETPNNRFTLRP